MSSSNPVRKIIKYYKQKEKNKLIENSKYFGERNEVYLRNVEFDEETRNASIEFEEITYYRTIVKYITKNYIKYPIYSEIKTKKNLITKKIKLNNYNLENLELNDDYFVSKFAEQIIAKIHDIELMPSWFVKKELNSKLEDLEKNVKEKISNITELHEKEINLIKNNINKAKSEIKYAEAIIYLNKIYVKKFNKKIEFIDKYKDFLFVKFATLGIFNYFVSNFRKNRLLSKLNNCEKNIQNSYNDLNYFNNLIQNCEKDIKEKEINFNDKIIDLNKKLDLKRTEFKNNLNQIVTLKEDVDVATDFILLKKIIGMEYQRIVGCYVIRNRENNKCYVGQSKDIMKRIKQHFRGTKPKNIIFAEDYFNSKLVDKSLLFEIRIIPLKTKDELDECERKLIDQYDSFRNGYNATSGNY